MSWNRAMSPSLIHPKFKALLSSLTHVHTELLTTKRAPTTTAAHLPIAAHPEEVLLGAGRGQMQELEKVFPRKEEIISRTHFHFSPPSKRVTLKDHGQCSCTVPVWGFLPVCLQMS